MLMFIVLITGEFIQTTTMITNRLVSAEQFSVASCNLNCKYCYIPKSKSMKLLNKKIINKLGQDDWLNSLESVYGRNLTHFGLWGAEPTLTLKYIPFQKLFNRFPKLRKIAFSTNLMTNPQVIVDTILKIDKYCHQEVIFEPQISLDGPAYITDVNRVVGAAKKIPENIHLLIVDMNQKELKKTKVEIRMKSTLTMENIRLLNSEPKKVGEYFNYFNQIEKDFKDTNQNNRVNFVNSCSPTLCVPGRYTSEDGGELAKFFKLLRKGKHPNTYLTRFQRILRYRDEITTKPSMFTCSGGDSNLGIGMKNDLHLCHRTFFLNYPEYIESILSQKTTENWDVSLFEEGKIKLINEKFIVNTDDEVEKARFYYILRNYHDFWRLKISYIVAMLKELALAGQASKCYLNDELAVIFGLFVNICLSCPMENILNTGCIHFAPVSLIRLFGNGAFEEILEEAICDFPRGK